MNKVPAMILSSKTWLVVTILAVMAQPAFAGGRIGGGGGVNFSRPGFKQPAVVNRSLPGRNLGNFQTLNPTGRLPTGVSSAVVRNNQIGNALPNPNLTTPIR